MKQGDEGSAWVWPGVASGVRQGTHTGQGAVTCWLLARGGHHAKIPEGSLDLIPNAVGRSPWRLNG